MNPVYYQYCHEIKAYELYFRKESYHLLRNRDARTISDARTINFTATFHCSRISVFQS